MNAKSANRLAGVIFCVFGLSAFGTPTRAEPRLEFQEHYVERISDYIVAKVHIFNPDSVDYNRVFFACQLYDADGHPFYSEKTLEGPLVTQVAAHTAFHEVHRFVAWGKDAARADCKVRYLEPIDAVTSPDQIYLNFNRTRVYE